METVNEHIKNSIRCYSLSEEGAEVRVFLCVDTFLISTVYYCSSACSMYLSEWRPPCKTFLRGVHSSLEKLRRKDNSCIVTHTHTRTHMHTLSHAYLPETPGLLTVNRFFWPHVLVSTVGIYL